MAYTMLSKSSLRIITSEAFLQTYVPASPIAKPTSAFFSAGASLVPSPVTETTWLFYIKPRIKAYLSSGLALAITAKLG